MSELKEWDPYRVNIGKCDICGVEEELHQILGDDVKKWHVCKKCLKEQWRIDIDNQR